MKKFMSILVIASLLLCCTVVGVSPAQAVSAADCTLTTIDEKTVPAAPQSPERISIIMFGPPDTYYTPVVLDAWSQSMLSQVKEYRFMFANISKSADKAAIEALAANYPTGITFCYGNYINMMWDLIDDFVTGSVSIPLMVFIDSDGVVRDMAAGNATIEEIEAKIRSILGDRFIEPPKDPSVASAYVIGSYYTNIQEAIDRINEIRYEACEEGIEDAFTGKPLTRNDYHPVVWSATLEKAARQRAAEAILRIAHVRPNDKSGITADIWHFADYEAEYLAWNYTKDMVAGINQFYREKENWITKDGGQTGHYTAMINPNFNSVGLGGFYSACGAYPSCLCMFLADVIDTDKTFGQPTEQVEVPLEIKTKYLSNPRLTAPEALKSGETATLNFLADTEINGARGTVYLRDELTWKSSDDKVLTVDNGVVKGVGAGAATVTATDRTGISASAEIRVTAPVVPTAPEVRIYRGDTDGDGTVTILDATVIQRQLADLPVQKFIAEAADADKDGSLTIMDATAIQRHIAGLTANDGIEDLIPTA